LVKADQAYDA